MFERDKQPLTQLVTYYLNMMPILRIVVVLSRLFILHTIRNGLKESNAFGYYITLERTVYELNELRVQRIHFTQKKRVNEFESD